MPWTLSKLASWALVGWFLSVQASEALRILGMFPIHGKSHFVMCESLMRGLAKRGHQVDVYSHFPLKKKIPNYTDYSLAGSIPVLSNNMSYELLNSFSASLSIPRIIKLVGNPVCELLNLPIFQDLIKNPPNDPPYDLVIVELFVYNCHLAWGHYLKVPTVVVVTLVLLDWLNEPLGNPVNIAVEPSVFSKNIAPMNFFERLNNFYIHNYVKYSFNYEVHKQDALVKKLFGPHTPGVIELQKEISLALVNYHPALNGIRPFTPAVVPVAGLHIVDSDDDLPKEVQKFLDESKKGFIYFSFGSMVRIETFPRPVLDAFYSTFKKIAPVRILMKIAKPEELPPGLPSNVITQSWLPQIKVLKHKNIKAFITHGGLMGTQESIYHGVPMIGFPLFGDQHFNIESYVKRNMAIKLDRYHVTEESFTKAVFEILKNPIYKQSVEKVGRSFRNIPMSPIDTATFWIEYVARHGKDALRSPIVDMPWWQASLLDVYAFLATITLTVLLLIKFIINKLMRLVWRKQSPYSNSKLKKN